MCEHARQVRPVFLQVLVPEAVGHPAQLLALQLPAQPLHKVEGPIFRLHRPHLVEHLLHIGGLLRTMYDPRNSLTVDVSTQLISHFGDRVYGTVIPRNVRLAEAPSYGMPVLTYDKSSRGAVAYLALAGEMNRRLGQTAQSK